MKVTRKKLPSLVDSPLRRNLHAEEDDVMNRMAEGGEAKKDKKERERQEGVHQAAVGQKRGPSYVGELVREGKQPYANRAAKEEHEENLKQLRSMPKPKLQGLAEGGEAEHPKLTEYKKHSDADYEAQQKGDAVGGGLDKIRGHHDTLEDARRAHGNAHPEARKHYAEADAHYKNAEKAYSEYKRTKLAEGGTAGNPTSRIDTGFGKIIARAEGGKVEHQPHPGPSKSEHQKIYDAKRQATEEAHLLTEEGERERQAHNKSMVDDIMSKRRRMAEGGQVDLNWNAEESENVADDLNMEALGKENYSESEGLDELTQPEDSNEKADSREDMAANKHDRIAEMRKRIKSRE